LAEKPPRFDIGGIFPEPVEPETDASGLYLTGDYIGFYNHTSENADELPASQEVNAYWQDRADAEGFAEPPGYWPAFITSDGSFSFTDGKGKGIRFLTLETSLLLDVERFKLRGYTELGGGLDIDSAGKYFSNLLPGIEDTSVEDPD